MAAAIDRQFAEEACWAVCGDDLTDEAFRQAYAELSRRDIPFGEIEAVVEGTRQVRIKCFDLFGPPNDPYLRRHWEENLRGRLVGCFAIRPAVGDNDPSDGEPGLPDRVQFEDETRTIVVDSVRHPVEDTEAYYAWKFVYQRKTWVTNKEIAGALGKGNEGARMDRLKKRMPLKLRSMVGKGKRGKGNQIVLPQR
jgi:hypothetical protein